MNAPFPFHGCGTALITPFTASGALDEAALRKLVQRQVEEGIDFLVPAGSTGEAATLSRAEYTQLVRITVEVAARASRKVPVLAGATSNNTAELLNLARELAALGIDGLLSAAPFYNKPTQEGMFQHFSALADAVNVPIVLYNVPGRTASNLDPATVLRLAKSPRFVGIKEASGNPNQVGAILAQAPAHFAVLSGDDQLTLPILALGGHGLISVAANVIPAALTEMIRLARQGDFAAARQVHFRYLPLMDVHFIESNPIPVKAVMAHLGLCENRLRLPLTPLSDAARARLTQVLAAYPQLQSAPVAR